MFDGVDIARGTNSNNILGQVGDAAKAVNNSTQVIMNAVVMIVAFALGGFTTIKAIMAIQKKQQKEALLYGIGALLCFVVALFFVNRTFLQTGENLATGDQTLTGIIGEATE